MRFMILVKANKDSEAGVLPDEKALTATSTEWAPWFVVPADHKWVSRTVVADVLTQAIRGFDMKYPVLPPEKEAELEKARRKLEDE